MSHTTRNNHVIKLMLALVLTTFTMFATAQELTINHVQGETTVPVNPEVVFSYDVTSIDTLTALGVTVDGMPPLNYAGAEHFNSENSLNIGSLFEPDYELVNAEQPDLVIVAARSAAAYPDLSKIAPTIDLSFTSDDFVGEFKRNVMTLASIFGKEAEATEKLDAIDAQIADLQTKVSEGGTGLVIMVSGGNVSALAATNAPAGRGSLLYQVLGLKAPVEDVEAATHGEPISFEFLLEHNPDWLFVIDRDAAIGSEGAQPAAQVLDNDLMHETTAWQENQIVYLNPFDWYIITGAGLDSMQRMLDEIAAGYAQ